MKSAAKSLRACEKGHQYYKSSDCPVCPLCEKEKKPVAAFYSLISAPARRALERAGILSLAQLAKRTEADLLDMHGMGPNAVLKLRAALKEKGLSFRKN